MLIYLIQKRYKKSWYIQLRVPRAGDLMNMHQSFAVADSLNVMVTVNSSDLERHSMQTHRSRFPILRNA